MQLDSVAYPASCFRGSETSPTPPITKSPVVEFHPGYLKHMQHSEKEQLTYATNGLHDASSLIGTQGPAPGRNWTREISQHGSDGR